MNKFIFAYYKKEEDKYLLKVVLDGINDDDEIWAETTEAVYNFAKKNFEENEKCEFEYEEEDGRYTITKILKKGKTTKKKSSKSKAKYTCEDCGKELKDDKYKKCYNCNKKNPIKKTKTSSGEFRTPEQITKDYLANSTATVVKGALVGMQGHLNPNTVTDITVELMKNVYKKFQELVG